MKTQPILKSILHHQVNSLILGETWKLLRCLAVVGALTFKAYADPGILDVTFDPSPGANNTVTSVALQTDGKIVVGGGFGQLHGQTQNQIGRLKSDGSLDTTFNVGTGPNSTIYTILIQPDGKILVGGGFSSFSGIGQNGIVRLNTNGNPDLTFNTTVSTGGNVSALGLASGGKIVIGGNFTTVNGMARTNLAQLNSDGSVDANFNPAGGPSSSVKTLVVQSDNKVVIGGFFTSVNGTARNYIARVNTNGSLDLSFTASADSLMEALALQPDGKIIAGGFFANMNGVSRKGIARLNAAGDLDVSFNPGVGTDYQVVALAIESNGKTLVGGYFTKYNNISRNGITRINADGSLDGSFDPGKGVQYVQDSEFNGEVYGMALQPDQRVIIGGLFDHENGTSRLCLARLWGDPPLTISNTRPTISLSWTATATNYILQQSSDLGMDIWSNYAGTVNNNGTNKSVAIIPPGNMYFRLKK
jgi:uncharacterized delta-60 repeat protein